MRAFGHWPIHCSESHKADNEQPVAFITSPSITNIWLKRNPLGPGSANSLVELITRSRKLRTLDLDQTELGDIGVGLLFFGLTTKNLPDLPLRHIYLSGTGIAHCACKGIQAYLRSSNCSLESLYVSNNPLGNAGAEALAQGLNDNTSLNRLNVRSSALTSTGAIALMDALTHHPRIKTLDLSFSFATVRTSFLSSCTDARTWSCFSV